MFVLCVGSFWLERRLCILFVTYCVMLFGLFVLSSCCCGFNVCVLGVIRCVSLQTLFCGLCVLVCVCACVKLVCGACDVLCDVVWAVVVLCCCLCVVVLC